MKDELVEDILNTIRHNGNRITKVRRALIKIFCDCTSPKTALELQALLKKARLVVNKTTVYRELEFLLTQNIIGEIDLIDGMKRYELKIGQGHHHHLVCTTCNTIKCVEMEHDLDKLERRIERKHGFIVTSHVLEFFGQCQDCQ